MFGRSFARRGVAGGHLVRLVDGDTAELLQQVAQRQPLEARGGGELLRVVDVDEVQVEVALQPQHVVLAAVEHLGEGGGGG